MSARNSGMDYAAAAAGMAVSASIPSHLRRHGTSGYAPGTQRRRSLLFDQSNLFRPLAAGEAHFYKVDDSDGDSSDASTIENNTGTGFDTTLAQMVVDGPNKHEGHDQGHLDNGFASDCEICEDHDDMVQKREESIEERQRREPDVATG